MTAAQVMDGGFELDPRSLEDLRVQRCNACGAVQHYPRPVCTGCGGRDLETGPASGGGTLHSFTVVHRSPRPDLQAPYVVALVRLDEGPVAMAHLVDADVDGLACDVRVRACSRGEVPGVTAFRVVLDEED